MPSSEDFADYPKGKLAQGAGDLIDVTNWSWNGEDGEKIVHTIRQHGAGSVSGGQSGKLDFEAVVSNKGFERDWAKKWRKREVTQFRLKLPGMVINFTGRLSTPSITAQFDDATKFKCSVIGVQDFNNS